MSSKNWITRHRKKRIPVIAAVLFVLGIGALRFFMPGSFGYWIDEIENIAYDTQVRKTFKPLSKNPQVAIIAIDDKSLKEQGRLPWSRDKMALLCDKLQALGAATIAFDFIFASEEVDIVDVDAIFANTLKKKPSVLGFALSEGEEPQGVLPEPLLTLTPDRAKTLYIPEKNSFLGNLEILQKAAQYGGFINSSPDPDGTLRFSPLLLRHERGVFGALALEAARLFLGEKKIELISKKYHQMDFLEAIKLGDRLLPVDYAGKALIGFRGPANSFPMISATDVLMDKVAKETIQGKLLFIGATATASGELVPTSIAPSFPSIEVHATIAQGIIDRYIPLKPAWSKGVTVALILFSGLALSFFLPYLGPLVLALISLTSISALFFIEYMFWVKQGIVFSVLLPALTILVIFLFDTVYGYFVETRYRQAIREIFGQYVSSEYIELMLKQDAAFEMVGESKILTILFIDIRHFTTIAETMSAQEVKTFLNFYFTAMTEIIFDHKGTIDKYIGDAIMAFWGAPLEDGENSYHAVKAALAVQEKMHALNQKGNPIVEIGIGLATGSVYVGDMGSKYRRSYTALGDTVNLASRLEGLTKYYGIDILVSEDTQSQTKDLIFYRKLDDVQVKGKEKAVGVYQPLCKIEEVTPALQKEVDMHTQALNFYASGQWQEAKQIWQSLDGKKQGLYSMYLHRMETSPPPGPGWNGVQKSETK